MTNESGSNQTRLPFDKKRCECLDEYDRSLWFRQDPEMCSKSRCSKRESHKGKVHKANLDTQSLDTKLLLYNVHAWSDTTYDSNKLLLCKMSCNVWQKTRQDGWTR